MWDPTCTSWRIKLQTWFWTRHHSVSLRLTPKSNSKEQQFVLWIPRVSVPCAHANLCCLNANARGYLHVLRGFVVREFSFCLRKASHIKLVCVPSLLKWKGKHERCACAKVLLQRDKRNVQRTAVMKHPWLICPLQAANFRNGSCTYVFNVRVIGTAQSAIKLILCCEKHHQLFNAEE